MNNPDNASEPSMDEILASIRKIIAEEPADASASSENGAANPLLTGTELRAKTSDSSAPLNERPRPSHDRLSSAIKALAATAPAPPEPIEFLPPQFAASSRPSFDDDLADLLDEPPKAVPFTANYSGFAADAEAAPAVIMPPVPEEVQAAPSAAYAVNGTEIEATSDAEADSAAPSEPALPATPPLPRKSPWEAMRKTTGFWPPQSAPSSLPPQAFPAAPSAEASTGTNGAAHPAATESLSQPEAQEAPDQHTADIYTAPTSSADLVARLHAGLYEATPAVNGHSQPSMQFATPLGTGVPSAQLNGESHTPYAAPYATNGAAPGSFVPPLPSHGRPVEAPTVLNPQPADPFARPPMSDAMMDAALASLMSAAASSPQADPYGYARPAPEPGAYPGTSSYARAPYPSAEHDPAAAAAAAFDALAQGLGGAPYDPRRPYDYQPTPARATHTALVAQPLVPAVPEYHPQPIRTLEDAVAEMLKPMLQKWLADNMPRIIERALRVEAASGMKPPGSS